MSSRLLDSGDLEAFQREIEASGAPIRQHLLAGATRQELELAERQFGSQLPDELRTWFQWHSGIAPAEWPPEHELGPVYLLALEAAARGVSERRAIALQAAEGDEREADMHWWTTWMPIAKVAGLDVALDLQGSASDPVPVYYVDWQYYEQPYAPNCASLQELVQLWTEALHQGIWTWDAEQRVWRIGDASSFGPEKYMLVAGT